MSKRIRNAEALTEEIEAKDKVDNFRVSSQSASTSLKNLNPDMVTGAELEKQKTEARGVHPKGFQ